MELVWCYCEFYAVMDCGKKSFCSGPDGLGTWQRAIGQRGGSIENI